MPAVKSRLRNSRRSIIGALVRCSRRMKTPTRIAAATSSDNGAATPELAARFSASRNATTAGAKNPRPSQSNRIRGARSRDRGSSNHAKTKPITPTGPFRKKIDRQPATPISKPPTVGPSARPTACAAPWMPMARPRLALGIAVAISATEFACSIAAPSACTTRKPMRTPRVGENPQPIDASVKTAKP